MERAKYEQTGLYAMGRVTKTTKKKKTVRAYPVKAPREVTFNGETLSLKEWAARTGLKQSTITTRLRSGWSVEDTLTRSTERQSRVILKKRVYRFILEYKQDNDGIAPTLAEISEHVGTSSSNAYLVLWSLEQDGLVYVGRSAQRDIRVKGGRWIPPEL